jgi:hypothetical protein
LQIKFCQSYVYRSQIGAPSITVNYLQHAFWGTTSAFNLLDFGLPLVDSSCLRQGLDIGHFFLGGVDFDYLSLVEFIARSCFVLSTVPSSFSYCVCFIKMRE